MFHANFVRWMDEGFSDWATSLGIDFAALVAADPGFVGCPLVSVRCAFSSPARFGDALEHRIGPAQVGGRSFKVPHRFFKGGAPVAEGEQVRIWGRIEPGEVLRALPIPPDVRALLGGAAPVLPLPSSTVEAQGEGSHERNMLPTPRTPPTYET